VQILGISGSLRRGSHNTRLLRATSELLPPPAQLVLFDGLKEIPPYDADDDVEPWPEPVRRLRDAIAAADAVLIATPEYNHSIPGQLKNAIDWVSRPAGESVLRNVPVAVIGASTGSFGAVWAQAELRKVLSATGARVLDRELPVGLADQAFDEDGRLVDDDRRRGLAEVLGALTGEVQRRESVAA
jgi:chromate reductase